MIRRLEQAVRDWLRAETSETRPESALVRVFRAHPGPAPRANFAARVLARLAAELAWGRRRDIFAHRGLRALVGGALALVGAALAFVPDLLGPRLRRLGAGDLGQLGDLASGAAGALTAGIRWLAEGLDFWRLCGVIGEALAAAATRPEGSITLLASAFLAIAAFRALNSLITTHRST